MLESMRDLAGKPRSEGCLRHFLIHDVQYAPFIRSPRHVEDVTLQYFSRSIWNYRHRTGLSGHASHAHDDLLRGYSTGNNRSGQSTRFCRRFLVAVRVILRKIVTVESPQNRVRFDRPAVAPD